MFDYVELLGLIDRMLDGPYSLPMHKVKQEVFIQNTFSRWALFEFRHTITRKLANKEKTMGIMGEIEIFRAKMNAYACEEGEDSIIFSIAEDAITDLMDRYIFKMEEIFDEDGIHTV